MTLNFCRTCEERISGDFGITPEHCRACVAEESLRICQKETASARHAYDQLIEHQRKEKELLLGRVCRAIQSHSLNGYSESTVKHFQNVVVSAFKG